MLTLIELNIFEGSSTLSTNNRNSIDLSSTLRTLFVSCCPINNTFFMIAMIARKDNRYVEFQADSAYLILGYFHLNFTLKCGNYFINIHIILHLNVTLILRSLYLLFITTPLTILPNRRRIPSPTTSIMPITKKYNHSHPNNKKQSKPDSQP